MFGETWKGLTEEVRLELALKEYGGKGHTHSCETLAGVQAAREGGRDMRWSR